jgi:hypothetical protein
MPTEPPAVASHELPLAVMLVVDEYVEKRFVAVRAVELAYAMVVAPVKLKSDDVASAVGTPLAPVMFARMELAAMLVSPAVPAEYVMPLLKVVVALLNLLQSAAERNPAAAEPACATWMEVPAPRVALVPPVMVRIEEPVSVREPRVVVETAPVPLPRRTVLELMVDQPVPPFATESAALSESVPAVRVPSAAVCAKRFVEDAVVAKEFVEVELVAWNVVAKNDVEVELSAVKFCSVVEPSVWKLVEKSCVAVSAVELA